MTVRCLGTDEQLGSNLGIAEACAHQFQHIALPSGQPVGISDGASAPWARSAGTEFDKALLCPAHRGLGIEPAECIQRLRHRCELLRRRTDKC